MAASATKTEKGPPNGSLQAPDDNEVALRLSRIKVGVELAVLWPEYRRYFSGKVKEHHGGDVFRIKYDTGLAERTDISKVNDLRIVTGTPYRFSDESYEIYWPSKRSASARSGETAVGEWRPFSDDEGKVRSTAALSRRCGARSSGTETAR